MSFRAQLSNPTEIRFSLMAVVKSRIEVINQLLASNTEICPEKELFEILKEEEQKVKKWRLLNENPLLELALNSLEKIPSKSGTPS